MNSFVVAAIFKNETMTMKEWIDHYKWQGASHIYLGDNGSTDNPLELLKPYIDEGFVTYFPFEGLYVQIEFDRCVCKKIQELQNPPDWILIADLDEFWFGEKQSLNSLLKEIPDSVDVIYKCWREFGPSEDGFQPESLRQNLLFRNPAETSPKYIFRTNRIPVEKIFNHEIRDYPEERVDRENKSIHCHHYHLQSLEHYHAVRIPRGYMCGDLSVYSNKEEHFDKRATLCTLYDNTLANLVINGYRNDE